MSGTMYGYIRVSTKEQNEDRQRIALRAFGVAEWNIVLDKRSGKDFDRPGYRRLLKKISQFRFVFLGKNTPVVFPPPHGGGNTQKNWDKKIKPGDTLVIKSIDRLGRDHSEILEQWRTITEEKRAAIVVLDMPLLDTRQEKDLTGRLIADIVLQLLSYVAQTERELIRQRQAEGIAAAKARGVRFGRRPMERPEEFQAAREAWQAGALSARGAARQLGITHRTFLKWASEELPP